MKKYIKQIINRFGYDLVYNKSIDNYVNDFPVHFKKNLKTL